MSKIERTDKTWNPVRGCSRVSPGCQHCYAELMAARFSDEGLWGHGFAERTPAGPRWTRQVELIEEKLWDPYRWQKPCRVFVNSTSDLWHPALSFSQIERVYSVMKVCLQHTFQVLTKRPERRALVSPSNFPIGLPNVWEGTSVENRDVLGRIDELRATPAAVRFLSVEPLLEDLGQIDLAGIDWVIIGGESGPGARPMKKWWADEVMAQAEDAGIPIFMKQAGSVLGRIWGCSDSKGGDMSAWPEWWRVREFPETS